MIQVGTACLVDAFEDPRKLAAEAARGLEGVDYDTMVGVGFSGALAIPGMARELGKNYLILRKSGDSHSHGNAPGEGTFGHKWVFVDDGVRTGHTYKRARLLVDEMARANRIPEEFQGAWLYGHGFWTPPTYLEPGSHHLPDVPALYRRKVFA